MGPYSTPLASDLTHACVVPTNTEPRPATDLPRTASRTPRRARRGLPLLRLGARHVRRRPHVRPLPTRRGHARVGGCRVRRARRGIYTSKMLLSKSGRRRRATGHHRTSCTRPRSHVRVMTYVGPRYCCWGSTWASSPLVALVTKVLSNGRRLRPSACPCTAGCAPASDALQRPRRAAQHHGM